MITSKDVQENFLAITTASLYSIKHFDYYCRLFQKAILVRRGKLTGLVRDKVLNNQLKFVGKNEKRLVEDNKMEYQQELKTIEEHSQNLWWKPTEGQYRITITGEPKGRVFEFKDPSNGEKQSKIVVDLPIMFQGQGYTWTVTRSRNKRSCWAQLVKIGAETNKLTNTQVTVIIVGQGKQKQYTVIK